MTNIQLCNFNGRTEQTMSVVPMPESISFHTLEEDEEEGMWAEIELPAMQIRELSDLLLAWLAEFDANGEVTIGWLNEHGEK